MRGRGDRLEKLLAERELDRLLVTDLVNVRYLTGFSGTNGACVCGPETRLFFTDFRYTERAAAEVEGWEPITVEGDWLASIAERLEGRVGFEDDHMSVRTLERLKEKLAEGVEAVPAGGLVEQLRRVKDEGELAAIAAASELADEVWLWSLERGLRRAHRARGRPRRRSADPRARRRPVVPGDRRRRPQRRAAARRARASARSAAASWSSSTWARSSTATAPTAPAPSPPASRASRRARSTRSSARPRPPRSRRSTPGVTGEEVDAVARKVIDAAGHGDRFGHGLGHGVGLEVHEAPRLSQRSDDVLEAGEVVTVEPGVYLPGELGVRIEDLVVVTEDGHRNLSGLPKDLQLVE